MRRIFSAIQKRFFLCLIVLLFFGATPIKNEKVKSQIEPFLVTPFFGEFKGVSQGWSTGHKGIDYTMRYDSLLACEEGTLMHVGWYRKDPECHQTSELGYCGYGLHIKIKHPNDYWTVYGHMSSTAFGFDEVGSRQILQGQLIGTSGHNGFSTGPHLHFEVKPSEWSDGVNPYTENLWKDGNYGVLTNGVYKGDLWTGNFSVGRLMPKPNKIISYIVDDEYYSSLWAFSKGSGGLFNNRCDGNCNGWTRVTGTGYGSDMYHTPADGNTSVNQWARWLNSGMGIYEVKIHVPATSLDKSWQAPYFVEKDTLIKARGIVDQEGLPDPNYSNSEWVSIGTYSTHNSYNTSYSLYTTDATRETYAEFCKDKWCKLTVDAVKFERSGTTFLPDVKFFGSWYSRLYLRNDGAGPSLIHIEFLDSNGSRVCSHDDVVQAHEVKEYVPGVYLPIECFNNNTRSAVIDSTQAISTLVVQERNYPVPQVRGAYTGVTQPTNRVHIPVVHRNNYRLYSHIFIQNTGIDGADYTVEFIKHNGSLCSYQGSSISPGGHYILASSEIDCLDPIDYYGSAVINATQPIAVTSSQANFDYDSKVQQLLESPFSDEAPYITDIIVPLIQNYNYGYYSGTAAQNSSGYSFGYIATRYYIPYGQQCDATSDYNISPGRSVFHIAPGNPPCEYDFLGAKTSASVPSVMVVNQLKTGTYEGADYPGINKLGTQIVFPFWNKAWNSGLVLFNPNLNSTSVSLQFYSKNGTYYTQLPTIVIQPNDYIAITGQPGGSNWVGSLVVLSQLPIAGIANHTPGTYGDKIVSHKGIHRFP